MAQFDVIRNGIIDKLPYNEKRLAITHGAVYAKIKNRQ